jgi:hypothetical protein
MSKSGVSHRGRWSLGYRSVWVGIYVVDARGYCLGNVERTAQARRRVVDPEQVVLKGEIGLFQRERRDISDDFRTGRVAVAMGYSIALNGNKCADAQLLLRAFILCCRIQFQYGRGIRNTTLETKLPLLHVHHICRQFPWPCQVG